MTTIELIEHADSFHDTLHFVQPDRSIGCIEPDENAEPYFVAAERNPFIDNVLDSFDATFADEHTGEVSDGSIVGRLDGHEVKVTRSTDPQTGDIVRSFVVIKRHHGEPDVKERLEEAMSIIETSEYGIFAESHSHEIFDDTKFDYSTQVVLPARGLVFGKKPFDPLDFALFEMAPRLKRFPRFPLRAISN